MPSHITTVSLRFSLQLARSKVLLESKTFFVWFFLFSSFAAEPAKSNGIKVVWLAPNNNGVDSVTRSYEISKRKADCKFINSIICYCSFFSNVIRVEYFPMCVWVYLCVCVTHIRTLTTERIESLFCWLGFISERVTTLRRRLWLTFVKLSSICLTMAAVRFAFWQLVNVKRARNNDTS